MIKKIVKAIFMYSIFYFIELFIFSLILYRFVDNTQLGFKYFLLDMFMGNRNVLNSSLDVMIIFFIKNIIEVSAMAVLTSYIFAYILNREPKIIFPEKLVIRHRTSWECKNKLTLGILIGNKSKFSIHNAVCTITCVYIKQTEPLLINSEITLRDERVSLENFYRFSFDLTKFPRQILKDMIEKPEYFERDTILVCVTGSCNYLGNSFKLSRNYKLSDIVFDEHKPNIVSIRKNIITGKDITIPFTERKLKKIHWNEILKIVEVDENKRIATVEEIKNIIRKMDKKKRKK